MANSTWISLTNKLLRRVNDVEITQSDFASARGIQASAKDYIQDTVREINTKKINWPFNAVEHSQNLEVGVEEYAWPVDFTAAEWGSFQIQKDDALGNNFQVLELITRDEWYAYQRDKDYGSEAVGIRMPQYVFPSHGNGWGVSPSPDKVYPIKFRYYKTPVDLTAHDTQVTIPPKFDYVIIAGGLYYMNIFKENLEGAALMKKQFDDGLANMINSFLPNEVTMRAPLFNRGGGQKIYSKHMWTGY